MKKLSVKVLGVPYDVMIGQDVLSKAGEHIRRLGRSGKAVIISDTNVSKLYSGALRHSLRANGIRSELLVIQPGERTKSLVFAERLYNKLLELKVHRDDMVIALGGGVVGDLAGFVAATYMRGLKLVQIPTTLLAQVDSSIGGKTAVNLETAKNSVGVFYQPSLVFSDVSTLITLPAREIRNGLAEIIKYGVIRDPELFTYLEKQVLGLKEPKLLDPDMFKGLLNIWENIVARSAAIKAKVVIADPFEKKGLRHLLNFGHTIGHAVESLNDYKGVTHGEGVALGMIAVARIAAKMRITGQATAERIEKLIGACNLPTAIKGLDTEDIIARLILDKKVKDGKIVFVLPKAIGSAVMRNDVPVKVLRETLKSMGAK